MAERFNVTFSSADDSEIDAVTTLLEDKPMTEDEIVAACERYKVAAKIAKDGKLVRKYVPETAYASSDITGMTPAWYRCEREASNRPQLADIARRLTQALATMETCPTGTPEYQRANVEADAALNDASNGMHFNESLAPVF